MWTWAWYRASVISVAMANPEQMQQSDPSLGPYELA